LGVNEAVPSQGGFLVPQQFADGIRDNMWQTGTVLSLFSPDPVEGNNMTINLVDETSRADGSRNGGILAYWENEAADATATKPKFRQANLKLKRVTALCYATEEQLEDVSYMGSWLTRVVPQEIRFKVEDAIIDGDGVGKPLGILRSGALISATRADASKIAAADVLGMWSRRYLGAQDYVWFVNQSAMPQLQTMTLGDMPVYQPPSGLAGNQHGYLLGKPVVETEYNPYLGSVGDVLLAAPSKYAMIDKGRGIQSASSIHVQFVSWQQAFRFGYRVDGQPEWASAITAFDGTNTISPFVALAATT
jgi:HK97 family phage major capsid protein